MYVVAAFEQINPIPLTNLYILFLFQRHITVCVGSPDKSPVLPEDCRATKCGQHGSLEILITNVELLEMTFTAASHMNTAAKLRASAAQL